MYRYLSKRNFTTTYSSFDFFIVSLWCYIFVKRDNYPFVLNVTHTQWLILFSLPTNYIQRNIYWQTQSVVVSNTKYIPKVYLKYIYICPFLIKRTLLSKEIVKFCVHFKKLIDWAKSKNKRFLDTKNPFFRNGHISFTFCVQPLNILPHLQNT